MEVPRKNCNFAKFLKKALEGANSKGDYSRIVNERFDPIKKAKRHSEVFSLDLKNAFDMGISFASK